MSDPNVDATNPNHVNNEEESNEETNQEEEKEVVVVHRVESKEEVFEDADDDAQESRIVDNGAPNFDGSVQLQSLQCVLDKTLAEKERIEKEYREERESIVKEVTGLAYQLKSLAGKQLESNESSGEEEIGRCVSSHELMSECSKFVEVALEERLQNESLIMELHKQIEELNVRVQLDQNNEVVADRILGSLGIVVNQEELLDHSDVGTIVQVERSTSLLVDHYKRILYEIDQLKQFLSEGGLNIEMQAEFWPASVLSAARTEFLEGKKKEQDLEERLRHLEQENRKFVEEVEKERAMAETINAELGKVNSELEQEKSRYANTKEKLSMAVNKGKALVQQRDTLKQSLADKSSELERCLAELQEKSNALEAVEQQKEELIKSESLVASLEQALSQRNAIVENIEDIISQARVPDELETTDVVDRLKWLVNLVPSLQEMISQKNATIEDFENFLSQVSIPGDLKSTNGTEKLKWLVDSVSVMQDRLSQRNLMVENFEEVFSQISVPPELESSELTEKLRWVVEERNALKGSLLEFDRLKIALSVVHLPETASSSDFGAKISCLKESVDRSKQEISTLKDEMARSTEAACNEIDRSNTSLSMVMQEKAYMEIQLGDLTHRYESMVEKANQASSEKDHIVRMLQESSGVVAENLERSDVAMFIDRCFGKIKEESHASRGTSSAYNEVTERVLGLLCVTYQELTLCEKLLEEDILVRSELNNLINELRMEKDSLQKDLERSEEKSALVREKLSLAVKKGKGLVQDRENLKLLVDEKNSEVEKLKLELQQQASNGTRFKDNINRLSTDIDEKNSEIEKLKLELQQQELTVSTCKEKINQLSIDIDEKNSEVERLKLKLQQQESDVAMCKDQITQLSADVNEKNSQIEHLMLELQQQESFSAKSKAQIDELSANLKQIPKLEAELVTMKDQQNQLEQFLSERNSMLQTVLLSVDRILLPVNITFEEPVGKLDWLAGYMKDCEEAKNQADQQLERVKEEARTLANQLAEVQLAMKSMEDDLLDAKNHISQLAEEKKEIEVSRSVEYSLPKSQDETIDHTSKFMELNASIKSLEDALSIAENKISELSKEHEEARLSKAAMESELEKLREEVIIQTDKVTEAYRNIESLKDALSQAETQASLLTEQNRSVVVGRANLENELKELKHEAESQAVMLSDASKTIKSLEDALSQASSDISMLGKNEILALNSKLTTCTNQLSGKDGYLESRSAEIIHQINDLEMSIKDDRILSLIMEGFMKEFENLKHINIILDNIRNHPVITGSELLPTYPGMEDDSHVITSFPPDLRINLNTVVDNGEVTTDADNICLHIKKMVEVFESRNKTLADNVDGFSKLIGEIVEALLRKLGATRDALIIIFEHMESMKQEMKNLTVNEEEKNKTTLRLEKDCGVLQSACVNATNELRLEAKNNLLDMSSVPELEKLRNSFNQGGFEVVTDNTEHQQTLDESNCAELASKLLSATRTVQSVFKLFESAGNIAVTTIEDLQNKLRQSEEEHENATKERDILENKVSKLENEVKALQNSCRDLSLKIGQYRAMEEKLQETETEVSKVPSYDKDELQSKLSAQNLEIERLKDEIERRSKNKQDIEETKREISELTSGLEKIINTLGGNKIEDQKSADGWRLLPVLEKQVMSLSLEAENSKSLAQGLGNKLAESQKVIDEFSRKMKLLEDSLQSRDAKPEFVQERSIFEAPSLPTSSEISEIEDAGTVGEKAIASAPAAHVRTMRKGSSDHLALNVDLESVSLVNGEQTDKDKGHVFKSLNTSGLIPKQGKLVADRVDGLWVSGGRVLMNKPRARLGVIAYCIILHLWLLGTIL